MNKQWHEEHKLDKSAPPLSQVAWHEAHQKNCGCNPIPANILKLMPPSSAQS